MNRKHTYFVIIFLMITSLIVFGRIANNDFIHYDDNLYITDNLYVQSGFDFQNIKWAFTAIVVSNWHPLTLLSHMLDWSLFGNNAGGHHLVSLLLHIGSVILLFLFLYKTTRHLWPSAFAAAFFALHPLRVESVAWAAERKDVLSMFFAMTALYAYAFYAENRRLSKYLLCLFLFALALMSKPMMVTFPFVLLLLDYWPLHRLQIPLSSTEKSFKTIGYLLAEKIPFFVLAGAVSAIAFWAQHKIGAMVNMDSIPLTERLSNAAVSYGHYLWKIFWPANLAVFYPFEHSLPVWKLFTSAVMILIITAFVFYFMKKLPFLFTGWFLYLGTLIPVIGLVQVGDQAMADRYTYLPSIGISIMLAWGCFNFIKTENNRKAVLLPMATMVLILLASLTWQRCGHWKNSIILFRQAIGVTQKNDKMHHNLGASFFKEGRPGEALYHFNQAIRINPTYPALNGRGDLYARAGRYREALHDFNKVISIKPDFPDGYYNRGLIYEKLGHYQLAIDDFSKAIQLNHNHSNAYNSRGIVYARSGQYQPAINDFTKALSINPGDPHAYGNRAIVHFQQGNNAPGCQDVKAVCDRGDCRALEEAQAKGLCR